jgi:hypothetical protein
MQFEINFPVAVSMFFKTEISVTSEAYSQSFSQEFNYHSSKSKFKLTNRKVF